MRKIFLLLILACTFAGAHAQQVRQRVSANKANRVNVQKQNLKNADDQRVVAEKGPNVVEGKGQKPLIDKGQKVMVDSIAKIKKPEAIASPAKAEKESVNVKADNDKIYDVVEEKASFPGGDEAFYKWIVKNLRYPEECKKNEIGGRVMITSVIEKDGSITDPNVSRSPDKALSDEAIRLVTSMPKWNPGKMGGKPVRCHFTIPIAFRLP